MFYIFSVINNIKVFQTAKQLNIFIYDVAPRAGSKFSVGQECPLSAIPEAEYPLSEYAETEFDARIHEACHSDACCSKIASFSAAVGF